MFDRSQLTRLITLAVATCAVTWMLAASALARPDGSTNSAAATAAPAYKVVPGDVDKAPSASTAPAYQPQIGDSLKTPDPVQVDRVLAGIGNKGALPHSTTNSTHDVDPLVIVLSLVALVAALGAATLIVTHRQQRPVLQA
jgi:hypothetical protein